MNGMGMEKQAVATMLSSLFTDLAQLNQLLDEYRLQEYWQRMTDLLYTAVTPKTISLRLFDTDPLVASTVVRLGELAPSTVTYLEAWEASALNTLAASASLWSSIEQESECSDRAWHIYLIVEQVLRSTLYIFNLITNSSQESLQPQG